MDKILEEIAKLSLTEKLNLMRVLKNTYPYAYLVGPMSDPERKFYDAGAKRGQ